jgi:hypothetical protein
MQLIRRYWYNPGLTLAVVAIVWALLGHLGDRPNHFTAELRSAHAPASRASFRLFFFANASGKFEQRRVRILAFAFAAAAFAFAIVRTVMASALN